MQTITVTVDEETHGQRLDKVLAAHAEGLSRARVQALMDEGKVTRNGAVFDDASYKVRLDETYVISVPPAVDATPEAQEIPLDIVYEDEDLLVLNKSPDMVVHPGAGNHDGTLVNALLAHCGDTLSGIGGVRRPGIVHRLDKETSGLMVVAKNDAAHQGLSAQLSSRTLKRVYHAVVWGMPQPAAGRIETQIGRHGTNRKKMAVLEAGGREAITDYRTLETFGLVASRVECRLQTGRTHQIRVHMAHQQNWLVGDPVYGKPAAARYVKLHKVPEKAAAALLDFPRQALHAAQLEFIHPLRHNKVSLAAPLPADMAELLAALARI
jgi:23S rRNA pseudouridine1911/1915/1917 synthase